MSLIDFEKCQFCGQAKITKDSRKSITWETELFDLIHFELCELDVNLTRNRKRYVITFIDDCSDYTYVYLMKNKSDMLDTFKLLTKEIENQLNKELSVFVVAEALNMNHTR